MSEDHYEVEVEEDYLYDIIINPLNLDLMELQDGLYNDYFPHLIFDDSGDENDVRFIDKMAHPDKDLSFKVQHAAVIVISMHCDASPENTEIICRNNLLEITFELAC